MWFPPRLGRDICLIGIAVNVVLVLVFAFAGMGRDVWGVFILAGLVNVVGFKANQDRMDLDER